MSCNEATVKPGRKLLNDGAVLADRELLGVRVMNTEGEAMSLLEEKSQLRQFLVALYLAYLKDYLAAAPEEVARVEVLAGNLENESVWDLHDLAGGPGLGSLTCNSNDYGHIREALRWLVSRLLLRLWTYYSW